VKTNLNFIEDHQFLKEVTKEVKSIESRVGKKEKEILAQLII
jgi:formiminotetrahydrofolate cyclodeaminase